MCFTFILAYIIVKQICEVLWPNRAFDDRSMKLGMQFGTAIRSIFGYRDNADTSHDKSRTQFSKWPPMNVKDLLTLCYTSCRIHPNAVLGTCNYHWKWSLKFSLGEHIKKWVTHSPKTLKISEKSPLITKRTFSTVSYTEKCAL